MAYHTLRSLDPERSQEHEPPSLAEIAMEQAKVEEYLRVAREWQAWDILQRIGSEMTDETHDG